MKALLHLHTSFSFDGVMTVEACARRAREEGVGAIFITDHSSGMSRASYAELVRAASETSDGGLTVVPGVEIPAGGGSDLLAVGVRELPRANDIEGITEQIHAQGGVAILSHPHARLTRPSNFLSHFDGIEVWNGRRDSRYFPDGASLRVLREAKRHNPAAFGCCGLDLHTPDERPLLYLDLDMRGEGTPLGALRAGAFTYGRRNLRYPAGVEPSLLTIALCSFLTAAHRGLSSLLAVAGCTLPGFAGKAMRRLSGESGRG